MTCRPASTLPGQVSKVCGCLTATYIGGSANLAEVALDSGLAQEGGGILACLAAADVLLMCFYFAGLMLVPGSISVDVYGCLDPNTQVVINGESDEHPRVIDKPIYLQDVAIESVSFLF